MKTKRNIAAVISAPREAGDNIPNMANTKISQILQIFTDVSHYRMDVWNMNENFAL